jgi:hypothetical protein
MRNREKTIQIGDTTYALVMLDGNHGTWLFIYKDGVLLFEQAGFKDDAAAIAWGDNYVRADAKADETDSTG